MPQNPLTLKASQLGGPDTLKGQGVPPLSTPAIAFFLTFVVPQVAQLLAAGFSSVRVSHATTQSGTYTTVTPDVPLVAGQTSYTLFDGSGGYGCWYALHYVNASGATSLGTPFPGYQEDLFSTIRDLLGVTTTHVSDSQIQGFSYLPAALARVRSRFPAFDTTIAAGGDAASLCLGALAHLTAALLCPRMTVQVVDSEQFDKYRYQLNRQMDWSATQAELLDQYEILISQAAGETAQSLALYPVGTILAGPTTAGYDTSAGLVPLENDIMPYTTKAGGNE